MISKRKRIELEEIKLRQILRLRDRKRNSPTKSSKRPEIRRSAIDDVAFLLDLVDAIQRKATK